MAKRKVVRKSAVRTTILRRAKRLSGTSNTKIDNRKTALPGGLRKTGNPHKHHGKIIRKSTTYSERRKNRAD